MRIVVKSERMDEFFDAVYKLRKAMDAFKKLVASVKHLEKLQKSLKPFKAKVKITSLALKETLGTDEPDTLTELLASVIIDSYDDALELLPPPFMEYDSWRLRKLAEKLVLEMDIDGFEFQIDVTDLEDAWQFYNKAKQLGW